MQTLCNCTLTAEEIKQFQEQGFAGPFTLCTPEEMAGIRDRIVSEVLSNSGLGNMKEQSRHLDSRLVYDICSHPAIVERMAGAFGPNLVLWRSHFFNKEPGAKEIPWHQDFNYWPLEPALNISAWVAIDECTKENSCVEIIPGSHKTILPTVKSPPEMAFGHMADMSKVDTSKVVYMEMKPGQFFLFNEKTLHRSEPNRSNKRRLGLAVRVTIPIVKVYHEQLFPKHKVVILRGEDYMGFNRVAQPPES